MSDAPNYLDLFPAWLRALGEDAEQLGAVVGVTALSEPARQVLAGGLNYLFKSLDLIPDGIDDIGYLDDCFVLRVSADLAMREDVSALDTEHLRTVNRLAGDADSIREFLGDDFPRLESYVTGLRKGAARGRSVQDILHDDGTRSAFESDLKGFARSYEAPSFGREDKNLIKLKAFFEAKLPK